MEWKAGVAGSLGSRTGTGPGERPGGWVAGFLMCRQCFWARDGMMIKGFEKVVRRESFERVMLRRAMLKIVALGWDGFGWATWLC